MIKRAKRKETKSIHFLLIADNVKPYTENELSFNSINKKVHVFRNNKAKLRFIPQMLRTPKEKFAYYMAYVESNNNINEVERIIDFIKRQTGLSRNKIKTAYKLASHKLDLVNIDSTEMIPIDYIKKSNVSVEDFILNPKYSVWIIEQEETND